MSDNLSDNYTFVPEINYWLYSMLTTSPVEQVFAKLPIQLNESEWRVDSTLLDLLFNYTFDQPLYTLYYRPALLEKIQEKNIHNRVILYAGKLSIYTADSTIEFPPDSTSSEIGMSTQVVPDFDLVDTEHQFPEYDNLFDTNYPIAKNIFNITYGEIDLLDLLLAYRNGDEINLDSIDYENLPSSLSKLIYIYLHTELTGDTSLYNSQYPIGTQDRLITWAFEKWLTDYYYVRFRVKPVWTEDVTAFRDSLSESITIVLSGTQISEKTIEFPIDKIPVDASTIYLVHDSKKQILKTDYDYIFENPDATTTISAVSWAGYAMETKVAEGQKMYMIWGYKE